jgi:kinesin family protein 20
LKLFESEMKRAIVEAETREEVMKEMEERMRSMEWMHARRLMSEVCFFSTVLKMSIYFARIVG